MGGTQTDMNLHLYIPLDIRAKLVGRGMELFRIHFNLVNISITCIAPYISWTMYTEGPLFTR